MLCNLEPIYLWAVIGAFVVLNPGNCPDFEREVPLCHRDVPRQPVNVRHKSVEDSQDSETIDEQHQVR